VVERLLSIAIKARQGVGLYWSVIDEALAPDAVSRLKDYYKSSLRSKAGIKFESSGLGKGYWDIVKATF
jgi:hypothetical protein